MHLMILRFRNGDIQYVGPFPTYFRANEYGLACRNHVAGYAGHDIVKLTLPVTVKARFS